MALPEDPPIETPSTASPQEVDAAVGEEEPLLHFSQDLGPFPDLAKTLIDGGERRLQGVMDIGLMITVELGRCRMAVRDVLKLGRGSVIPLSGQAGDPLDILVNDVLVAQGEVVVVDNKYGIRLTDIVLPDERVKRLRG